MLTSDKFHDECGVVAIFAHPEAEKLAYLGLHALQHRGQESAGIVTSDGLTSRVHKAMGTVAWPSGIRATRLRAIPLS
jgi:amidophosphoribosyltransferase